MENVFSCCAGLDVHKESVEAHVRRLEPDGQLDQETRHWPTMTADLLGGWLRLCAGEVLRVPLDKSEGDVEREVSLAVFLTA